ncbi:hypothetical protein PFFCH_00022, partial [Plasmodium falciparum FCH/4]
TQKKKKKKIIYECT